MIYAATSGCITSISTILVISNIVINQLSCNVYSHDWPYRLISLVSIMSHWIYRLFNSLYYMNRCVVLIFSPMYVISTLRLIEWTVCPSVQYGLMFIFVPSWYTLSNYPNASFILLVIITSLSCNTPLFNSLLNSYNIPMFHSFPNSCTILKRLLVLFLYSPIIFLVNLSIQELRIDSFILM